jgi:carboxypeptidase C (cathepsin A)
MRMNRCLVAGLTTLLCLSDAAFGVVCAQSQEPAAVPVSVSQSLRPLMHVETDHQGAFGGKTIRYKAIVDETPVKDAGGNTVATIVSTSYIRSDVPKGSNRPVLFAFNGGPGSASIWLHMGLLGPKRVAFKDDTKPETTAPFQLVDNSESPMDVADIVIIDPPGTGYSQVVAGHEGEVYGTDEDASAVARFIETWLRQHHRQNSPKFLFGESYGTIRAARLAKLLAGGPSETGSMTGISLNGVFLMGQAMDLTPDGDLEYLTTLPTLAATAWYHGAVDKTATTLEKQVADAKAFAAGEYLRVLYLGDGATIAEKASVATELSQLTGLSTDFIARHNLRISARDFASEVLASQNLQIGMYDSRFTLPLQATGNDPVADDPAMGQYVPGYLGAWSDYASEDLGLATTAPYRAIEFRTINGRWNWGEGPGIASTKNFAEDLAVAMRRNPSLKLLVGEGLYDLVTTPGKADYTISHAGINPAQVTYTHYAAGHMSYLGAENRIAVATDLRRFLKE